MSQPATKIGYVVSRFPKLTETFILLEMLEMEKRGITVVLMPLRRHNDTTTHAENQQFTEHALYCDLLTLASLRSHLYWLRANPSAYMASLWLVLRRTIWKPPLLVRSLVTFTKAPVLASSIRATGLSHVHAHWASHPTLATMIAARLTGCTFSFTAHAHDIFVDRTLLREKLSEAAVAFTISTYNRKFLIERLGPSVAKKIQVVRCGIELTRLLNARPERMPAERLNIICVGSLEEKKGQAHLVRACADLVARGHPLDLNLIGDGPVRGELEDLVASLNMHEHVVLRGMLSRDEVLTELASADIFVLPSIVARNGMMEGIPVALMEAMAVGLPVVATAISGVPELVRHEVTGILVPPGDEASLADAIDRLMTDSDLRLRLVRAGTALVKSDYDIDHSVDSLLTHLGPYLNSAAASPS